MKPIISPSILSADFGYLARDIEMLNESEACLLYTSPVGTKRLTYDFSLTEGTRFPASLSFAETEATFAVSYTHLVFMMWIYWVRKKYFIISWKTLNNDYRNKESSV